MKSLISPKPVSYLQHQHSGQYNPYSRNGALSAYSGGTPPLSGGAPLSVNLNVNHNHNHNHNHGHSHPGLSGHQGQVGQLQAQQGQGQGLGVGVGVGIGGGLGQFLGSGGSGAAGNVNLGAANGGLGSAGLSSAGLGSVVGLGMGVGVGGAGSLSAVLAAAGAGAQEDGKIYSLVIDLMDPSARESALLELSKKREQYDDLALVLWHSFGIMPALLQEIVSVYPLLSPPNLTAHVSNRVCNALALLQCVASHTETRQLFLNAHIPLFLYPFLNTTSKTRPFEYLRLTSLGVIGALVKQNDNNTVIHFLLSTEIIPLCLRIMETGSELSKTVAIFIVQKILLDETGLTYICHTYERFYAVGTVLSNMVNQLVETQAVRLLKHVVRCYLRLSDNLRAREALRACLPEPLRDNTFSTLLKFSSPSTSSSSTTSNNASLPPIKAWFPYDNPSNKITILDLKKSICTTLLAFSRENILPSELCCDLEGFELLDELSVSGILQEGDLVVLKRRETIGKKTGTVISKSTSANASRKRKRSPSTSSSSSSSTSSDESDSDSDSDSSSESESSSESSDEGSDSDSDSESSSSSASNAPSLRPSKPKPNPKAAASAKPKPKAKLKPQSSSTTTPSVKKTIQTPKTQTPQVHVPPGFGSTQTHKRNLRRRLKKKYDAANKEGLTLDPESLQRVPIPPSPPGASSTLKGVSDANSVALGQKKNINPGSVQGASTPHTQPIPSSSSTPAPASSFSVSQTPGATPTPWPGMDSLSLSMFSLGNKNKKKGFKRSLMELGHGSSRSGSKKVFTDADAEDESEAIVDVGASVASGSNLNSTTTAATAATNGVRFPTSDFTFTHPIQPKRRPRLIPPSEKYAAGNVPKNVFVTSVDVEKEYGSTNGYEVGYEGHSKGVGGNGEEGNEGNGNGNGDEILGYYVDVSGRWGHDGYHYLEESGGSGDKQKQKKPPNKKQKRQGHGQDRDDNDSWLSGFSFEKPGVAPLPGSWEPVVGSKAIGSARKGEPEQRQTQEEEIDVDVESGANVILDYGDGEGTTLKEAAYPRFVPTDRRVYDDDDLDGDGDGDIGYEGDEGEGAVDSKQKLIWEVALARWEEFSVVQDASSEGESELKAGMLVGWKALTLNPATFSPEIMLHIGSVIAVSNSDMEGNSTIASEKPTTQSVKIKPFPRLGSSEADMDMDIVGDDEGVDDEGNRTYIWDEVIQLGWRVLDGLSWGE
ncbi:hypothetical protein D9758_011750 [Tetrapyrgos nigripes]|uniref:Cell differentiation protein rcd1 n=1 Tax=Tetrapyrgos nigripes TaxID=182062 RepID=A0A8H5CWR9_9AGAR|nr:hypothetical protein D9758_011750 [Tetrapyrgos nigripes]